MRAMQRVLDGKRATFTGQVYIPGMGMAPIALTREEVLRQLERSSVMLQAEVEEKEKAT